MGLSINVGWFSWTEDEDEVSDARELLEELQTSMREAGIDISSWQEPTDTSHFEQEECDSFPHSFLHYLRRVYTFHKIGKPLTPTAELTDSDDALVSEQTDLMRSHLLCHSDADGYYFPIPSEALFEVDDEFHGSSYTLQKELLEIAPSIGIVLKDNQVAEEIYQSVEEESDDTFWREQAVWLTLWEATSLSIKHSAIIQYD